MRNPSKTSSPLPASFLLVILLTGATLPAQVTTYDFYVADQEAGTGKYHSGVVSRSGNIISGNVYSWRHQRSVELFGDLSTGVVVATWNEWIKQRVRAGRKWVWRWVNTLQSATINIQNASGGLPVVEENRRVLVGSWQEIGGDGQTGVFGGFAP